MTTCNIRKSYQQGFTLVELLIVISLVGILAGVTISIINPVKQRHVAEDGVRQANLEKYALGIEAYANATGKYPASVTLGANNVPVNPEIEKLSEFVSKVPKDEPTPLLDYTYYGLVDNSVFSIYVLKASDVNFCFRYLSTWGKIKVCPVAKCSGVANDAICI